MKNSGKWIFDEYLGDNGKYCLFVWEPGGDRQVCILSVSKAFYFLDPGFFDALGPVVCEVYVKTYFGAPGCGDENCECGDACCPNCDP